jgi:hypothetical protein
MACYRQKIGFALLLLLWQLPPLHLPPVLPFAATFSAGMTNCRVNTSEREPFLQFGLTIFMIPRFHFSLSIKHVLIEAILVPAITITIGVSFHEAVDSILLLRYSSLLHFDSSFLFSSPESGYASVLAPGLKIWHLNSCPGFWSLGLL